jgi:hypothetical protein
MSQPGVRPGIDDDEGRRFELKTYNLAVVVVPDQHEDGREAFQAYCPNIKEPVTWGDTRQVGGRFVPRSFASFCGVRTVSAKRSMKT